MKQQILVIYKSVTGFTEQYARWIAKELDCQAMDLREVSAKTMAGCQLVIFGGRIHAGVVDGLKQVKKLFEKSTAGKLIVFATGATPNTAGEMIEETWKNNFTPAELEHIPHFYLQSGLRYEKMPLGDKLMMKVFAAMIKRKKEKSEYERAMQQVLGSSWDHSSREDIQPLVSCVIRGK